MIDLCLCAKCSNAGVKFKETDNPPNKSIFVSSTLGYTNLFDYMIFWRMSHCLLSIQCRSAGTLCYLDPNDFHFKIMFFTEALKGHVNAKNFGIPPKNLLFTCKTFVMEITEMGGKTVSILLQSFLGQHNSFVKKKKKKTQVFLGSGMQSF